MTNDEIIKIEEIMTQVGLRKIESFKSYITEEQYNQAKDMLKYIVENAVSDIRSEYGVWP